MTNLRDDAVYMGRSVGKDELVFLAICTPRFQQENYVDCDDGE